MRQLSYILTTSSVDIIDSYVQHNINTTLFLITDVNYLQQIIDICSQRQKSLYQLNYYNIMCVLYNIIIILYTSNMRYIFVYFVTSLRYSVNSPGIGQQYVVM